MSGEEYIAKILFDEIKGHITYEVILDIVRQYPNLSLDKYRLLLRLRQKTRRPGFLLNNGFTVLELRDMILAGFTRQAS